MILEMCTGVGKSITGIEIIRRLGKKTLVIVPRIELNRQWSKEIYEKLGTKCGIITEGSFEDGDICVATYQTLIALIKRKDPRIFKYLHSIGLLIIDEVHLSASNSYLQICSLCVNTVKRVGLTGTNDMRSDQEDMKVEGCVGKVVYKYKKKALIEGYLAKPDITFIKVCHDDFEYYDYNEAYNEQIVNNDDRNDKIKKLVTVHSDKQILILVHRLEHGKILSDELKCPIITGQTNPKERKQIFDDFSDGKVRVLVGMIQIFQLGIDLPSLNLLINCSALSAPISVIQSLGRVLRKGKDKTTGYYFDFIDEGSELFEPSAWKRLKALQKEGHKPKIIGDLYGNL